jgi:hypothetical protein
MGIVKTKGRRVAVAATILGAATIAAAGFVLYEPVSWWWRVRNVAQLEVSYHGIPMMACISESAAVRRALDATRKLLRSLPREDDEEAPDERDVVEFSNSSATDNRTEPTERTYWLLRCEWTDEESIVQVRSGDKVILGRFRCPNEAWLDYLREIARPAVPALVAALRVRTRDRPDEWSDQDRLSTAAALAFLAPETDGIVDVLVKEIEEDSGDFTVIRALRQIGSRAAPTIPALVSALRRGNWTQKEEAIAALASIGPGAAAAVPALMAIGEDPDTDDETMAAVRAAIEKIRGR